MNIFLNPNFYVGILLSLLAIYLLFTSFSFGIKSFATRYFYKPKYLLLIFRVISGFAIFFSLLATFTGSKTFLLIAGQTILLSLITVLVAVVKLRIPVTRHPQPAKILLVSAHPDDVELACAGSVARFIDEGHEVRSLVMSDGAKGGNSSVRPKESIAAANFLGIKTVEVKNLTDCSLNLHMLEMVAYIEKAILEFNPDLIFTHSTHDIHQDHQAVHAAVMRAARHHDSILCFESPSVTHEFRPSIFVDTTDYMRVKNQAIAFHDDQMGKSYMAPEVINGIGAFRGRQGRIEKAEGFEVMRFKLNHPKLFPSKVQSETLETNSVR